MRNRREELRQMEEKMRAAIHEAEKLKMEVDRVMCELAEMKAVPENCGIEDVLQALRSKLYEAVGKAEARPVMPWVNINDMPSLSVSNLAMIADVYCKLDMHAKIAQGADMLLALLKESTPEDLAGIAERNGDSLRELAQHLAEAMGTADAVSP